MSYVSGFMLGASIGKAVHSFLHGSPQSTVTPGRGFCNCPAECTDRPPDKLCNTGFCLCILVARSETVSCSGSCGKCKSCRFITRRFGKSEGHYVCTGKCHNGRYSYLC